MNHFNQVLSRTCFTAGESPRDASNPGGFYGIEFSNGDRTADIYEETIGTLRNLHAGFAKAGMGLQNTYKMNIFLFQLEKNKSEVIKALEKIFGSLHPPSKAFTYSKFGNGVEVSFTEAIGFPNETDLQITAIANEATKNKYVPLEMFDSAHKIPETVAPYSHIREIPSQARIQTIYSYSTLSSVESIYHFDSAFQNLYSNLVKYSIAPKNVLSVRAEIVNPLRADNTKVKMDEKFFKEYNEIWNKHFNPELLQGSLPPVRATVEVKKDSLAGGEYIQLATIIRANSF